MDKVGQYVWVDILTKKGFWVSTKRGKISELNSTKATVLLENGKKIDCDLNDLTPICTSKKNLFLIQLHKLLQLLIFDAKLPDWINRPEALLRSVFPSRCCSSSYSPWN